MLCRSADLVDNFSIATPMGENTNRFILGMLLATAQPSSEVGLKIKLRVQFTLLCMAGSIFVVRRIDPVAPWLP